ncbi:hypothetical protein AKO1_001680 [Acrasis kona]|uniref:Uncharacterized protein n=1 Tax=Acrasis kona TaxID=1008807 RepID=A0AAW2ZAY0_9EUKA
MAHIIYVEDLMDVACRALSEKTVTRSRLKSMEKKQHHDTWEFEDYFNASNYNFCPPDEFTPNHSDHVLTTESVNDPTSLTKHRNTPAGVNLYYQFVQSSQRLFGIPNIAILSFILQMLKSNKKHILRFKSLDQDVVSFNVQKSIIRSTTINWFGIGMGGAMVRDYDDHFWCKFTLSNQSNVYVDMTACQYEFFYYDKNDLPLHIFDDQALTDKRHSEIYGNKSSVVAGTEIHIPVLSEVADINVESVTSDCRKGEKAIEIAAYIQKSLEDYSNGLSSKSF